MLDFFRDGGPFMWPLGLWSIMAMAFFIERVWTYARLRSEDELAEVTHVDIIGTTKGRGYQGGMRRHGFHGKEASHGVERKHRSAGSIGGHGGNLGTGPKVKKGKRMAGQMGNARVTVRNIDVGPIDPENNVLLLKGPVPGPNHGILFIREATRLYKRKVNRMAAAGK